MQMEGDVKAEMSHYSGYPKQSPAKTHDWEELEDHYNMVDESTIEPDYFIDTAVRTFCLHNTLASCSFRAGRKRNKSRSVTR